MVRHIFSKTVSIDGFKPDDSGDIVVPNTTYGGLGRFSPRVIELMETKFPKSFPPEYIARLKRDNINKPGEYDHFFHGGKGHGHTPIPVTGRTGPRAGY